MIDLNFKIITNERKYQQKQLQVYKRCVLSDLVCQGINQN